MTAAQGDITTLSPENYARYAPLIRVIEKTDVKALALVYQRLYPLFQQSYEDLGYPGKYFNDRLVEVIDHLLQTPELARPRCSSRSRRCSTSTRIAELENRSAGQKLLMRMGPANERAIKAKLRELRAPRSSRSADAREVFREPRHERRPAANDAELERPLASCARC